MGKKKLQIDFITDPKRRSSVYFNRRSGLLKKAHDLSKVCGTKVSVLLTDLKGNLHIYSTNEDIQLYLKKSAIENSKSGKVTIYRYKEEDYPFTSVSKASRVSETFHQFDFRNLKVLKANVFDHERSYSGGAGLSQKVGLSALDGLGGFESSGDAWKVLGKRVQPPSSSSIVDSIPDLTKGLNSIQQGIQGPGSSKLPRSGLQPPVPLKKLKIDPLPKTDIEGLFNARQNLPNSSISPASGIAIENDINELQGRPGDGEPKKSEYFYQFDHYHTISMHGVIEDFQMNRTVRSRQFSASERQRIVLELKSFNQHFGEYLPTFDGFVIDYTTWRQLICLYFSDSRFSMTRFSELIKKVPLDEFLTFVALRPPEEANDASNEQYGQNESVDAFKSSKSRSNSSQNCLSFLQRKKDYSGIFIEAEGEKIQDYYQEPYIDFIVTLKRHFEVFIEIVLQKRLITPGFNLGNLAAKIRVPVKQKTIKQLMVKKIASIRSAWLINALKTTNASREDVLLARRLKNAKSITVDVAEVRDPELFREQARRYTSLGMMDWIEFQDLLMEKLFNDLFLYGNSQKILGRMFAKLGTEKAIQVVLKGLMSSKLLRMRFNQPQKGSEGASKVRPFEEVSKGFEANRGVFGGGSQDTGERLGQSEIDSVAIGGLDTESVQIDDGESLLDFFGFQNQGNGSVMSFDQVSHLST